MWEQETKLYDVHIWSGFTCGDYEVHNKNCTLCMAFGLDNWKLETRNWFSLHTALHCTVALAICHPKQTM